MYALLSLSHTNRSKKEVSRWKVVSGRTYMGTLGGSSVEKIIVHSKYDGKRNDYDIAMMKLSSPITVSGTSAMKCEGYSISAVAEE